jgi:S1-C subfamily serine protease
LALMTIHDPAGLSRACPACRRRVPRSVAVCRCGARLDDRLDAPQPVASSSDFAAGFRSGIGVVVGIGVIALAMYWVKREPAAPIARQTIAASPAPATPSAPLEKPAEPPPPEREPVREPEKRSDPEPAPPPAAASLEDVVGQVMPAVVLIETPTGRGSAFFVKTDTLLTNVHVVGNNSSVTIRRPDGTTQSARVEAKAPGFDIAMLKVSAPRANQAVIPLGEARVARVGQEVIAIGSPLGTLQNTVTRGIVSAVRQSGSATLVQTDAAVNPGNSGGPLLDRYGTAIGITTMGYTDRQGLNFAVGVEHARSLLDGRAPSPSTLSSPSSELRELSPAQPSETERLRAEGARTYEQTLSELNRRARGYDEDWQRFRTSCYDGKIVGSFDHEWFAFLSPERSMPDGISPRCTSFAAEFTQQARRFRDQMLDAEEGARQAGVYPGVRRETRKKLRLEHESWDR